MTLHTIDREEVMAYLDGELEQPRRAAVEAHLETCLDCRTLADELRQVSLRLSSWTVAEAPSGVRQALTTTIAKASGSSWWRRRALFNLPWVPIAWTMAGLTVIALLAPAMRSRRLMGPVAVGERIETKDSRPRDALSTTTSTAALPGGQAEGQGRGFGQGQGQGQGQGRARLPAATEREAEFRQQQPANRAAVQPADRMIVRAANIALTSDKFDQVRGSIERLVAAQRGRVTSLNLSGDSSSRRSLNATLAVPATNMDALLTGLRGLGRVQDESLGSDDVTESFRDLGVRTANARRAEQRLVELLARRTGDLADVLAVERELARVRLEIERMEAETRATQQRVDLATVTLTVHEQYRADLAIGPLPLPVQFKNAVVDGFRSAAESLVGASLAVLQVAPTLLVWGLLLAWPARWAWRRVRVHQM